MSRNRLSHMKLWLGSQEFTFIYMICSIRVPLYCFCAIGHKTVHEPGKVHAHFITRSVATPVARGL